jgi:hypothetical protein
MPAPALIYRTIYVSAAHNGGTFQAECWTIRSKYGVVLGEIYDRKLMLQVKELLGIKEASA